MFFFFPVFLYSLILCPFQPKHSFSLFQDTYFCFFHFSFFFSSIFPFLSYLYNNVLLSLILILLFLHFLFLCSRIPSRVLVLLPALFILDIGSYLLLSCWNLFQDICNLHIYLHISLFSDKDLLLLLLCTDTVFCLSSPANVFLQFSCHIFQTLCVICTPPERSNDI